MVIERSRRRVVSSQEDEEGEGLPATRGRMGTRGVPGGMRGFSPGEAGGGRRGGTFIVTSCWLRGGY